MKQLRYFLADLDQVWKPPVEENGERITPDGPQLLPIIGSAALMLQTDYERGTKDGDVLQTSAVKDSIKEQLLAVAGKDTSFHTRHRLYIDVVSSGLPFLPHVPVWHPIVDLNASLTHFDVRVLDVVDVVVSKLKRFHANDRADINAMIDRGLVDHTRLISRFVDAVDVWKDGAGADDLPHSVARLHELERDAFFVAESEIDLPSWI